MKSNLRFLQAARKNPTPDILYSQAINDLIPQAERFASVQAGPRPAGIISFLDDRYERWCNKWNFHFHAKMDELAAKYNLRTQAYQTESKQ